MKDFFKGVWQLTSSNANATRQNSNKFDFLSLLWQFFSYLFWPQIHHKHLPNN